MATATGAETPELAAALEEMMRNTAKLAKKQRRRMARWLEGAGIPYHPMDMTECLRGTTEGSFDGAMRRALECVEQCIAGGGQRQAKRGGERTMADEAGEAGEAEEAEEAVLAKWRAFKCEPCGRTLRGSNEWAAHQKANGHRKRCAKIRKLAKRPCDFTQHFFRETNTVVFKCTPKEEEGPTPPTSSTAGTQKDTS